MSEQPVSELQNEFSPRISGADLLDLLNTKYSRPKVLVIDVRDHEAYPFKSFNKFYKFIILFYY